MAWKQLEFNFDKDERAASQKYKIKDNDKIHDAEARFKAGDVEALVDIYDAVYKLADKYIHSESRKKRFFIPREEVLEKCNNIGLYIVEQYLKRPDFVLKVPSAYVWLRVMRELYHRSWHDLHITYTDKL